MEHVFLIVTSALVLALLVCVCAMLLLGAIKDEVDRRFEEHAATKEERGRDTLLLQTSIAEELGMLREDVGALQDRLYKQYGENGVVEELGWVQEALLHAIEQRSAEEA